MFLNRFKYKSHCLYWQFPLCASGIKCEPKITFSWIFTANNGILNRFLHAYRFVNLLWLSFVVLTIIFQFGQNIFPFPSPTKQDAHQLFTCPLCCAHSRGKWLKKRSIYGSCDWNSGRWLEFLCPSLCVHCLMSIFLWCCCFLRIKYVWTLLLLGHYQHKTESNSRSVCSCFFHLFFLSENIFVWCVLCRARAIRICLSLNLY